MNTRQARQLLDKPASQVDIESLTANDLGLLLRAMSQQRHASRWKALAIVGIVASAILVGLALVGTVQPGFGFLGLGLAALNWLALGEGS